MASPIIDPSTPSAVDAAHVQPGAGAHGYPRTGVGARVGDPGGGDRALVDEYGRRLSSRAAGRGEGGWASRRSPFAEVDPVSWQQALAGAALVGTGALLLWRSRQHAVGLHDARGHRASSRAAREDGSARWDGARRRLHAATDAIRDGAEQVSSAVSSRAAQVAGATREGVRSVGDVAQRRYDASADSMGQHYGDLKSRVDDLLHEQPLLVGAIGMAIGAAIGGLAPPTRQENEWLGGVRDDVVNQASNAVAEKVDALRETAIDTLSPSR
ncbi:MAG: hypothetical protein AB7P21_02655 [Lautropia sp.]